MDQQLVKEKIDALRRCINRIETKRPDAVEVLESDLDLQDILSVNLQRAVQLCVDIGTHIIANNDLEAPDTMAKTFDKLLQLNIISDHTATNMKKAVGFRNIAVHNYQKMNWDIVYNICHKKLDNFKLFAKEINNQLS